MSHKASRVEKFEERRAKQREIIAPLKKVYEDHDRDWFAIEQQIREELEAKKAEHRRQVLLALRKAVVAGAPAVAVAEELGVTRQTVYRWLRECEQEL